MWSECHVDRVGENTNIPFPETVRDALFQKIHKLATIYVCEVAK